MNLSLPINAAVFSPLFPLRLVKDTVEVVENINQPGVCLHPYLSTSSISLWGKCFDCSVDNAQHNIHLLTAWDVLGLVSCLFRGATRLYEDLQFSKLSNQKGLPQRGARK